MKKTFLSISLTLVTLALFGQAKTYFHDRIDTTLFAVADTVGNGANNYSATNLSPDFNICRYVNGCHVKLFMKKGITGAATLKLITKSGTLSVKSIKKENGSALTQGDILDSTICSFTYYNGAWRLKTSSNSTQIPFAGALLTGVSFPVAASYSMAAGDNDIYTVPSGKRALVMTRIQAYNTTTVTVTSTYPQIKISGTYYKLGTGFSLAGGVSTNLINFLNSGTIALEGGDVLSVNTNGSGISIWYSIIEYDSSNALRSSRILSLANGDNTLFTVPSGKTYMNANYMTNSGYMFSAGFFNNSGMSVNYSIYVVPSGQSAQDKYKIYPTSAVPDQSYSGSVSGTTLPNMSAGDKCIISTSSGASGQFAWTTYIVK